MPDIGTSLLIGIDEVGRGCGSGPIVACALSFLDEECKTYPFKDSKELSHAERVVAAKKLEAWRKAKKVAWKIASASADLIDERGIQYCNIGVMRQAALSLLNSQEPSSVKIIADGTLRIPPIQIENLVVPVQSIIKADRDFVEVSAASIIAKVFRDSLMDKLHEKHPDYCWNQNKGYLTAEHRAAIKAHGLSPFHRRSFCKKLQD